MKSSKKAFYLVGAALQIIFLAGAPLVSLAADPVVGAIILTPSNTGSSGASSKSVGPNVRVIFDKNSAKDGEKITASAVVSGFRTKVDELYYTWYIKRDGCDLDNTSDSCDLDDDGKVTINDWKIEGARAVVKNGFESNDVNYSSDNDEDGYEVIPSTSEWKEPEGENDDDATPCYIQEPESGRFYELTGTEQLMQCASGGTAYCAADEQITCVGTENICRQTTEPDCGVNSDSDLENYAATVSCDSGSAICSSIGNNLFSSSATNLSICQAINLGGGGTCSNASTGTPTCTFVRGDNTCKHLFPQLPDSLDEKVGDGDFGLKEEEFWGVDPNKSSTAENNKNDEANSVGLGAASVTWTYRSGDQIGVVIEGETGNVTKHGDGSYMRSWGFSKNICPALSDDIDDTSAFYTEYDESSKMNVGILTADVDLNNCLEDNLLDPTGGDAGTLQVNVFATPETVNNDPSGAGRGSIVRASASVSGTDDRTSLYYDWSVEASSDGTAAPLDESWIDITSRIEQKSTFSGFGLNNVQFALNLEKSDFPNPNMDTQYIRVKANVSENTEGQNLSGKGISLVKVGQMDKNISPYLVTFSDDGKASLDEGSPICQDNSELSLCPVTRNRVIGLTVPNSDGDLSAFSWKVDGEQVSCSSNISNECGSDNSRIFLPAIGVEGTTYEVTFSAKSSQTGATKTMARKFKVVKPLMRISTANEELVWPKQLGFYKNLDGSTTPDYSDILMQTNTGNTTALQAEFYPAWVKNYAKYSWEVNGDSQSEYDNENLVFQAVQDVGSTYNISLNAEYAMATSDEQIQNSRKALAYNWGVSPENSTEERLEASVQIEVVQGAEDVVGSKKGDTLFASIISNLPNELMFLLRLSLTVGVLIIVTGVIFAITPEFGKEREY